MMTDDGVVDGGDVEAQSCRLLNPNLHYLWLLAPANFEHVVYSYRRPEFFTRTGEEKLLNNTSNKLHFSHLLMRDSFMFTNTHGDHLIMEDCCCYY